MNAKGSAASTIMNRMFKATHKIKTTGSFHGKSNTLGHGGRAAQLKAQGVPGGVIGNLARAAHAAPGQANYHGGKKKEAIRKKSSGSMENGAASTGVKVNPATVKNPAWANAPSSTKPSSFTPKVSVSAPTPWTNAATGKALKKSKKMKHMKRKEAEPKEDKMEKRSKKAEPDEDKMEKRKRKASKLEMDAAYKRKESKKKVAKKMSDEDCE